jgi:hypothetical protein
MDQQWYSIFWKFHVSVITLILLSVWYVGREFSDAVYVTMTLFLLSIWCVGREFINGVDYIRRLSLSIHWRFKGVQLLCFRRRFMDQPWHSIFDNSMCQPWLYFCYQFYALVVNSLTLSITNISCHSVFIDDFKVYSYFVSPAIYGSDVTAFLTIPCISHDSIFVINLIHRSWIHWCCRLHTSSVT